MNKEEFELQLGMDELLELVDSISDDHISDDSYNNRKDRLQKLAVLFKEDDVAIGIIGRTLDLLETHRLRSRGSHND